jgi:hypothetical protein
MKGKNLKVGDLVPIYYNQALGGLLWIDKMGIITDIVGYKSMVLIDGALECWTLSDLKKMAAHKTHAQVDNKK